MSPSNPVQKLCCEEEMYLLWYNSPMVYHLRRHGKVRSLNCAPLYALIFALSLSIHFHTAILSNLVAVLSMAILCPGHSH